MTSAHYLAMLVLAVFLFFAFELLRTMSLRAAATETGLLVAVFLACVYITHRTQ